MDRFRNHVLTLTIYTVLFLYYLQQHQITANPAKRLAIKEDTEGTLLRPYAQEDESHRWPFGIIPYEIDEELNGTIPTAIDEALAEVHNHTCIHFVPRKKEENYIRFVPSDRCYALMGRYGGKQDVELAPSCADKGGVLHELMHTLGYGHEHTRPDRDEYVKILWDNIKPSQVPNFEKDKFEWNMEIKYDYSSILHYAKDTFSKKPGVLDTMEPIMDLKGGEELGQRNGLSEKDVQKVQTRYMCEGNKSLAPEVKPSCKYGKQRYFDGDEFIEMQYVMKCFAQLSGAHITRAVACLAGNGSRVEPGDRWSGDDGFVWECQLIYPPTPKTAVPTTPKPKQNKGLQNDSSNSNSTAANSTTIITQAASNSTNQTGWNPVPYAMVAPVGCISPNGTQVDVGGTWVSSLGGGPFAFVKMCNRTEDNGIFVVPVRCRYQGQTGEAIEVEPGCFKNQSSFYVSCTRKDPNSNFLSSAAGYNPPAKELKSCD